MVKDNKTIIWVSGIASFILMAILFFVINKISIGFYISNSDWLIIALLLWLIMISWMKAHDLDLNNSKRESP